MYWTNRMVMSIRWICASSVEASDPLDGGSDLLQQRTFVFFILSRDEMLNRFAFLLESVTFSRSLKVTMGGVLLCL